MLHLNNSFMCNLSKNGVTWNVGLGILIFVNAVDLLNLFSIRNLQISFWLQSQYKLFPQFLFFIFLRGTSTIIVERGSISMAMEYLYKPTNQLICTRKILQSSIRKGFPIESADSSQTKRNGF